MKTFITTAIVLGFTVISCKKENQTATTSDLDTISAADTMNMSTPMPSDTMMNSTPATGDSMNRMNTDSANTSTPTSPSTTTNTPR
ncbi:hypothetical protein CHRY9390_00323 [Chryseobacterium aquaeductus]|uniref:Cytochrome C551 n=1 Tax=Chryseobacterium aquaeductus TaxID=2675056 RepID=A0A9N8QQW3_9FLAO|nr:hypothetical protein [Chryseobacterium aquaeductus]CAA7329682.1 hypothetical protein CHRY9390_00323 [Chryseobacterium potabilaquae]CAD7798349.1 hypothetical protein CHRY9390_00323 [Chryseobacterium aquaeductus]